MLVGLSPASDLCPDMEEGKWLLIQSHLLSCAVERKGYCKCQRGVGGVLTMAGPHRGSHSLKQVVHVPRGVEPGL